MDQKHPHGEAKNVLRFDEQNKPTVIQETLDSVFDHVDVKNRKVVAFSIIGAYRKGKSFFLGYCLRYLYANYKSISFPTNPLTNPDDWMGDENADLKGFSWRPGTRRDTTGIILWSDVFLHTVPSTGEKIAIIIMDTQGLFDNQTSPAGNARIFSLGTLISSMQLLNLMQIVQEDQLQYLQFATEFAKFAAIDQQGQAGKPFQNLLFLIRDWQNADEYEFGMEGGMKYLTEVLKIAPNQKDELKTVRRFINSSFEDISCALLPFPGKKIAGTSKARSGNTPYNGSWKDMDEDFKDELKSLIEKLLNPDSLVLKKINGKELIGSEMKYYIDHYLKLFQSDNLPPALSIYESTVEKQIHLIVNECVENYKETVFKNQDLITNENQIPIFHEMSKNKALVMYKEKKKMGNLEHEKKFKEVLETQMNKAFQEWSDRSASSIKKVNEEKEKTKKALEEKDRLAREQLENEKKAALKIAEIERLKTEQKIEQAQYEHEKNVAALRLEAEQQRTAKIEAEKQAEEAFRKQLEAKLEAERWKAQANAPRPPPKKGWCTIA